MNCLKVFSYRLFQSTIKICQSLLNFRVPKTLSLLEEVAKELKDNNKSHPIIVSSRTVSKSDRFLSFTKSLDDNKINYSLYIGVSSDPTFEQIYDIYNFYIKNNCDSIISIGGGSVIDASKAMGILVTNKSKEISKYRGMLKVAKDIPFFIAIPTTAGTGSEATVASVVTNGENGDKFAISDPKLIPNVAVLDDSLLSGLPKSIISVTGMDALSHSIEAYVGRGGTKFSDKYAIEAIKMINDSLISFYNNPQNDKSRKDMLYASFYAGISFTRAYVGYIHALAHAVGGIYHKPHGYCIAIFMPRVLEAYGKKAYNKLGKLSDELNLIPKNSNNADKAKAVIDWIDKLNERLQIPSSFGGLIEEDKISSLAVHAKNEGNPWYPVPKELDTDGLIKIIQKVNI